MGNERQSRANPSRSEFCGSYEHALDDKGRVSLPAPFRQILSERGVEQVVLTNYVCDGARCLDGYSADDWQELQAKLSQRSRFDPKLRTLENYYLSRAFVCMVDKSGRINIPSQLRIYAGLEKDIVFTTARNGFRVWDKRVWELIFQTAESALLEDPSLFIDVDR